MNISADLKLRGGNAFLDTMGFLPLGTQLSRRDLESALNIENRWKASSFYPHAVTDEPGRFAVRLRRSWRRLFKRTQ